MESQPTNPAPASDTKATDDVSGLQRELEQRRKDLGYDESPNVLQLTKAMPRRELTTDDIIEREQTEARDALLQQKAVRHGMMAGLVRDAGERYSSCTLDAYQITHERQKPVVAAVKEYVDGILDRLANREGIVFFGPAGTGKDHLAFYVCGCSIMRHGRAAQWVSGMDWFGELRDGMDNGTEERHAVERLCRSALLVVSDPLPPFGPLTQYQASMLYRLVDARYSRGLTTICTLNVADDKEADARLGVQAWDRLCHGAWKLKCSWPSFRKPARTVNC